MQTAGGRAGGKARPSLPAYPQQRFPGQAASGTDVGSGSPHVRFLSDELPSQQQALWELSTRRKVFAGAGFRSLTQSLLKPAAPYPLISRSFDSGASDLGTFRSDVFITVLVRLQVGGGANQIKS